MTTRKTTRGFRAATIAALSLFAFGLGGCATQYGPDGSPYGYGLNGPNTAIGAVGGATAGGLIAGAAGASGAGIAGGAILGGLLGGAMGNHVDNANRPRCQSVKVPVYTPYGTSYEWRRRCF